jgi:hypothetical protein
MSLENQDQNKENVFLNLAFNILIPILILNKLSHRIGAGPALLLALAFPIAYGLWDYRKKKKMNFISVLGLTNTLVTGGLAFLGLGGIWFSVKEAAFPALIGMAVFYSAYTAKPAVEILFLNPALFKIDLIKSKVHENNMDFAFKILLKKATLWLAFSFFISALLNFLLSVKIFTPIDQALDEASRNIQLNEQIAQMHQWSFLVILLPSMIILIGILYYLVRSLKLLTGLKEDEFFKS